MVIFLLTISANAMIVSLGYRTRKASPLFWYKHFHHGASHQRQLSLSQTNLS